MHDVVQHHVPQHPRSGTLPTMTPRSATLVELLRAGRNRTPCVLATVVRTLGSAYMGVGARMVVHADGATVGMVSGGCLEADLAGRAMGVLAAGIPEVVLYDARSPDDLVWGLGLGCEGLVEMLLEPMMPDEAESLAGFLERAVDDAGATVVATVYRTPPGSDAPAVGARAAFGRSGVADTSGAWGDSHLLEELSRECSSVAHRTDITRGWTREYQDGALGIAFEVVQPPVHLLICGTGPDAAAVARLAHDVGWRCTIVGHRSLDGSEMGTRFPHAAWIESFDEGSTCDLIACEHRTAAIVMSHRYERDRSNLATLLGAGVRYIGVLGPRRRTDRMLAELPLEVPGAKAAASDRIHGPAGLDLGGEGPELVALAIVAEVAAVMHGREGGYLRERAAPIHDIAFGGAGSPPSVTSGSAGSRPMAASIEDRR